MREFQVYFKCLYIGRLLIDEEGRYLYYLMEHSKTSCFLSRQDITSEDLENFVDSPFKEVRKIIAAHDKTISYDVIKKLLDDESDEVVITVITESEAVKNEPLILFVDEII